MVLLSKRGFTLIELLVVIAIIGILTSVALTSLRTAKEKGADAAARASLNNARAQADLYYGENGNAYTSVCTASKSTSPPGILDHLNAADAANGSSAVRCFDESAAGVSEGWAMEAQLIADPTQYFCTDFTGNATHTVGTTVSVTDVVCGG